MGIMAKQDHVRSQSHQLWSLSGLGLDGSSLFFCDAVSCGLAWLLLDLVFRCVWNYLDQITCDAPWCLCPASHYPDGSRLSSHPDPKSATGR